MADKRKNNGRGLTPAGRKRLSAAKKQWWAERKKAKLAAEHEREKLEATNPFSHSTIATDVVTTPTPVINAPFQPQPGTLFGYLDNITENAALIIEDCKAIRKMMG